MSMFKAKEKNPGCLVAATVIAFIGLSVAIGGITVLSNRNTIIDLEEAVKAQHVYNKSDYDKMLKTTLEMVQVTDMYAEDFEKIYKGLIEGRYAGEEKQQLDKLFKVVNESNPTMDSSLYTKLQTEIASNRTIFSDNQGKLSDMIGEYNKVVRKKFITSAILNKEPMNAEDFIVTSDATEKAFDSGKAEVLNLRGDN